MRMHIKLFTLPLNIDRAYRRNAVKAADMCGFGRNQTITSLLGLELQRPYKI